MARKRETRSSEFKAKVALEALREAECVNIVVVFFDINHATLSFAGFSISASETRYLFVSRLPHRSGYAFFAS